MIWPNTSILETQINKLMKIVIMGVVQTMAIVIPVVCVAIIAAVIRSLVVVSLCRR